MTHCFDTGLFVQGLVSRASNAISPFLKCNNITPDSAGMGQFRRDLGDFFRTALEIKVLISLDGVDYTVKWPGAGDVFDPASMKASIESDVDGQRLVHLALFPSITRACDGEKGVQSLTAFKAVILLQQLPELF